MKPARERAWDDYFIPGTTVLRNLFISEPEPFGIENPATLREREEFFTSLRIIELREHPIDGHFDYAHLKAIHRHLFQDVYEWAGEERTAPTGGFMSKDGHRYFPAGQPLTDAAEVQFHRIAAHDYFRGLSRRAFVDMVAEVWGELNVIHSFREGNTRTQLVFFAQLIAHAGWNLNHSLFEPSNSFRDEFIRARFESQDSGSNISLAKVLDLAITSAPRSSN
ncbi:cell filamentation protein Fic [Mycetocola lacteus]|uniref:protein adenylyltransferase n=1 Tax=Mycetocola lacteus TaxID=76637 RepID=A0A3L7AYY8_9MICO|nr:Fic family protein [Mycetocola lacteus]RLP84751.1 cell filamentation protein Fic [Mycetocola lacteus]